MLSFILKNRLYFLAGFIIILFYFLRLINLTALPVFADEAIYIRWAQIMRAEETLRFLPLSDGKQPLFMWVAILFLKIFEDPLLAGRLLSVLSGFGSFIGITLLVWLLTGNIKSVFFTALIYSVSPYVFFFERMSLADSMLNMFGLWFFVLLYLSVTKKRLDYSLLAGFSLGGAWLTKSPALFFALLSPSLLMFINKGKKAEAQFFAIAKSLFYIFLAIIIGYAFYNILRLGPNFHMISSRNLDYVYPLNHVFSSPLDPLKPFLLQAYGWIWSMGTWPLFILSIIGIFINFAKYPRQILLLLGLWLIPVVIQAEFAKVLTARYLLFTVPYLIALSSLAFTNLKKWSLAAYLLLLIFLVQSLLFNYFLVTNPVKANLPRSERSGYLEEWTAGHGIKETADYIKHIRLENPSEKIVIGTEGYFGTLPDGLQMYLQDSPEITVIGVGLNFSDIPTPLKESKAYGNRTFMLINNERFKGDADKLGLKLIAEYKKAERPDGTKQSLMLYEL
jgi:4-amino-4-deoxy-L-arabinose transferase-like glycosyltransferase